MSNETTDLYSPLNFIPEMGSGRHKHTRTWIPRDHVRRLSAYRVLSQFAANRAATLRSDSSARDQLREFGDAELLITTARDLVLGETQTLRAADDNHLQWLNEWADKELLTQKLLTVEHDAAMLGDGVLTVGWSVEKNRPVVEVHDPGFFFPAYEHDSNGFPTKVAIAYEYKDAAGENWIRRYMWELVATSHPWETEYASKANTTCVYYAHDIRVDGLISDRTVFDMQMSKFQVSLANDEFDGEEIEGVDMGIDFIPVVHIPNTPHTSELFGQSVLLFNSRALSDLHNTDTDLALASQQAAPAVVTDDTTGNLDGGPGAIWGGTTTGYVDTSKNLVALQSHVEHLRDRIAQTSRISTVLLGQIAPNEVPSGYALELGFHPSKNLMNSLRVVRDEKYALLLKFVYRIALTNQGISPVENPHAWIELGAALPADKPTAIEHVKTMRDARAMSALTAVKTLQAAGFPIEDAEAEVAAIKSEWFSEAVDLVKATGNSAAAYTLLGLTPPVVREVTPEATNE